MKLRHPDLNQVIDVPDDDDSIAVHEKAGWVRVEEPVQANPALAPGEVETKPTKAVSKKADKADQDDD